MTELTILLLNAGRRVELLNCFRRQLEAENAKIRIVASDINTLAPAWHLADDRFLLPPSRDPNFVEALIRLCQSERITLVIPLIDPDLGVLADNQPAIEATGARVLVSPPQTIRICRDKVLTSDFLAARNLPSIPVLPIAQARAAALPLIVKPRSGSASIGVFKASARSELELFLGHVPDAIVQPCIAGEEFTVDVFCDPQSGRNLLAVPRRRLKVRGGEVSVGRIERDDVIESLATQVAEAVGIAGPANIQVIVASDGPRMLEINPRFGGGCPLSIAGRAPFVGWCIDIAMKRPLREMQGAIEHGLTMMRYDMSLFVNVDKR